MCWILPLRSLSMEPLKFPGCFLKDRRSKSEPWLTFPPLISLFIFLQYNDEYFDITFWTYESLLPEGLRCGVITCISDPWPSLPLMSGENPPFTRGASNESSFWAYVSPVSHRNLHRLGSRRSKKKGWLVTQLAERVPLTPHSFSDSQTTSLLGIRCPFGLQTLSLPRRL